MADGSASENSHPTCSNRSLGSPVDHNPPRSIFFPDRGPLSPTDKIKSPTCPRGKTIRDFEEELVELRKENFDLKMRIYIMEEHRDMFHGIENVDELYKMNADLKAEIETVKAELADKEDLILQAAKAMESLEVRHHEEIKKVIEKCENDKVILEEAYLKLQQELSDRKGLLLEDTITPPTPNKFDNSLQMYAMAFSLPLNKQQKEREEDQFSGSQDLCAYGKEQLYKNFNKDLQCYQDQIRSMENDIAFRDECLMESEKQQMHLESIVTNIRSSLKKTEFKNQMLVNEMDERLKELSNTCDQKDAELQAARATIQELEEMVKQLTEDLKEATEKRLAAEDKLVLRTEEKTRLEDMVGKLKLSSEKSAHFKVDEKQGSELTKRIKFLENELEIKSQTLEKLKNDHIKALKTTKGLIKQNKALMKEASVVKLTDGDVVSRDTDNLHLDGYPDCPGELTFPLPFSNLRKHIIKRRRSVLKQQ